MDNFGSSPIHYYNYNNSPINSYIVTDGERKSLKNYYFGTFMRALVHSAGSFVLAQILFVAMMLGGYEFRYTDDGTAIIDTVYSIMGSIPSIVFCFSIFIFDKSREHIKISEYFKTDKISGGMIIGFFGMIMFAYGVSSIAQNVLITGMFVAGVSPISEDYLTEEEINAVYLAVDIVFSAILAPVAEELMFRGVILRRLSKISQTFAIFMSALIFGFMHGNFLQAVLGFVVGIVLAYTAVKTESLILPIAGHVLINLTAVSSSFAQYLFGEDTANTYWSAVIMIYLAVGIVTFVVLLCKNQIHLPKIDLYHHKRTLPIMFSCVSFWILAVHYIVDSISKCGPVTDKLLE